MQHLALLHYLQYRIYVFEPAGLQVFQIAILMPVWEFSEYILYKK